MSYFLAKSCQKRRLLFRRNLLAMKAKGRQEPNKLMLRRLSLSFTLKNKSLFSATNVPPHNPPPMVQITTSCVETLKCTNFEVFGTLIIFKTDIDKLFGRKLIPKFLEFTPTVVKKSWHQTFSPGTQSFIEKKDFIQVESLRNPLFVAAEHFRREENFSSVQKPTISKDKDEKLKLAHKLVNTLNRTKRKFCVTLLQHNVDELETFSPQVLIFVRRKEDQTLLWNCLCDSSSLMSVHIYSVYWILYPLKVLQINSFISISNILSSFHFVYIFPASLSRNFGVGRIFWLRLK